MLMDTLIFEPKNPGYVTQGKINLAQFLNEK